MNINPVLNESNIGGHGKFRIRMSYVMRLPYFISAYICGILWILFAEFLRNLVHLPFFLQNAALRKVKHVKMLESSMKRNSRLEDDPGPKIIVC